MIALRAFTAFGDVFFSSSYGDKIYRFTITDEELKNYPLWFPDQDTPPLAPRKAVSSAREVLKTLVRDADKWKLQEIGLVPIGSGESKWVYTVQFHPPLPPEGIDGRIPNLKLVVLMNGTAVKPKIAVEK